MIWIAAVMMGEENEGGSIGLQFPMPPLPKRRRSTCFTKCIICQSDSRENLRKGKQCSVKIFISKLQIRQDDVFQRLSPNFDVLYENEVLWHASCYATYTSEQNIKYASNQRSSTMQREKIKFAETTSELCARISRSKAVPHDWSKCLFCKNCTHKKEKVMQSVSTLSACNTIMQCANAKGDQDMLRVLLGVSNDLVAAEAKYHKTCFASHVSKSNLKSQVFKEDEGKESVYDQAFVKWLLKLEQG